MHVLSCAELMELVPVTRSQAAAALNPLDNEGQIPENEDEEAEALLEAIDGTLTQPPPRRSGPSPLLSSH